MGTHPTNRSHPRRGFHEALCRNSQSASKLPTGTQTVQYASSSVRSTSVTPSLGYMWDVLGVSASPSVPPSFAFAPAPSHFTVATPFAIPAPPSFSPLLRHSSAVKAPSALSRFRPGPVSFAQKAGPSSSLFDIKLPRIHRKGTARGN